MTTPTDNASQIGPPIHQQIEQNLEILSHLKNIPELGGHKDTSPTPPTQKKKAFCSHCKIFTNLEGDSTMNSCVKCSVFNKPPRGFLGR